jgi:hypothetical protein
MPWDNIYNSLQQIHKIKEIMAINNLEVVEILNYKRF